MIRTTMKIEGMACSMCEAHINDVVRKEFQVKMVNSSYRKGQTVIISEGPLDEEKLRATVDCTGYRVLGIKQEEQQKEKKGLFPFTWK